MKTKFLLLLMILAGITITASASPPEDGKTIFTTRCAACHNVNKILVGPALAGVDQRRPIDWIINFVHSSQTIVKSGDVYAVALFEKFNKVQMPDHPDLTKNDILNIVSYIKTEAAAFNTVKPSPEKIVKKGVFDFHLTVIETYLFLFAAVLSIIGIAGIIISAKALKKYKVDYK